MVFSVGQLFQVIQRDGILDLTDGDTFPKHIVEENLFFVVGLSGQAVAYRAGYEVLQELVGLLHFILEIIQTFPLVLC